MRKAIETASSVEEMRRLRRMLDEGAPRSSIYRAQLISYAGHVPQGNDLKGLPRGASWRFSL